MLLRKVLFGNEKSRTGDERAWVERLKWHIRANISPLLAGHRSSCTVEEVMQILSPPPPHLVELEVITIKHLMMKMTNSFTVTSLQDVTTTTTTTSEQRQGVENLCDGDLPEAPVFVLGVLMSSASPWGGGRGTYTGLCLADTTGRIPCEVAMDCLPDGAVGSGFVIMPTQWNLIHSNLSKCGNYLELQEVVVVSVCDDVPPLPINDPRTFSVTSLKQHFSDKTRSRLALFDVVGAAASISDIFKSGTELFLVNLVDEHDPEQSFVVFVQVSSLLHFSSLMKVSNFYHFTSVKKMVFGKGSSSEMVVLSCTERSQIVPYTPQSHTQSDLTNLPHPPGSSPLHIADNNLPSSADSAPLRKKAKLNHIAIPFPHSSYNELVSYQGVVTDCVYPAAGVYQLDGRVHLYLTHLKCSNMGRGLRRGVRVQLSNVFVLRVTTGAFKHISGFFCCSLSNVRIVKFSHEDTPYKPLYSRNKVISLLSQHGMVDTAWLLDVFTSFVNRDQLRDTRQDTRGCFLCLQELAKMLALPVLDRDTVADFTSPPGPSYLQRGLDLSRRPTFPSLRAFKGVVTERVSRGSRVHWCQGDGEGGVAKGGGVGGAEVAFVTKAEWEYTVMRASDFGDQQFLVGLLRGSKGTGGLVIEDCTSILPLVTTMPHPPGDGSSDSTHSEPLVASSVSGCRLIITDYLVIVERTTMFGQNDVSSSNSTQLHTYLHPVKYSIVKTSRDSTESSPRPSSAPQSPMGSFIVPTAEGESKVLYFRVYNKNVMMIDPVHQYKFMCTAFVHPDHQALCSSDMDTHMCRGDVRGMAGNMPGLVKGGHQLHGNAGTQCSTGSSGLVKGERVRMSGDMGSKEPSSSSTLSSRSLGTCGDIRRPLLIALFFGGDAFRHYSMICNGCLYSLSQHSSAADVPLPSFDVLMRKKALVVTRDMKVQYVCGRGSGGCVQDVADLVKQLLLPPLKGRRVLSDARPSLPETVSIQGVIVSRSCRIDHMTQSWFGPSHHKQCRITALTLQSLRSPDTIMAYCEFNENVPSLIGLVPGGVVTLNAFRLKTSKSGNSYCTNFAMSSIDVNSMSAVVDHVTSAAEHCRKLTQHFSIPVSYLSGLMSLLVGGALSKSMVCVRASHVAVQRLSMEYRCGGCQCVITNGRCSAACLSYKPKLEVTARLLIEDGSGCGHVYVSGGLVRECLCVSPGEWRQVEHMVMEIGHVTFTKWTYQFQATEDVVLDKSKMSVLDKAKYTTFEWATRPALQRTFKLICQPFLSSEELERSDLGQRTHSFRLKGSEFNTLSLPRLQLRGVALMELTSGGYMKECESFLALLEQ